MESFAIPFEQQAYSEQYARVSGDLQRQLMQIAKLKQDDENRKRN